MMRERAVKGVKNSLGERLAEIRRERGVSQKDLALKLAALGVNVTNQAISKWEKGATQPNADQFLAICRALEIDNISESFMEGQRGIFHELNSEGIRKVYEYAHLLRASGLYAPEMKAAEPRIIPLYSMAVSAGTGQFLEGEDYENIEVFDDAPPETDYAVRISGDSMEPRFQNGQTVWVKRQETLEGGQIGIFFHDGNAYLKKLSVSASGVRLVSLNSQYEDIKISGEDELRVLGRVLK